MAKNIEDLKINYESLKNLMICQIVIKEREKAAAVLTQWLKKN